jgi:hypothetical protein
MVQETARRVKLMPELDTLSAAVAAATAAAAAGRGKINQNDIQNILQQILPPLFGALGL